MRAGARPEGSRLLPALVALAALLFSIWVLKHLSYPLLWNDEAETAMYAERILDFGYPKVHDGRNVIFELQAPLAVGLKEGLDAYIGSTWGQYYFGALGALAARGVDDVYTKTLLLRAPFALAGLAGIGVFAWLGASLFPEDRRRGLASALAFLAFAPLSTVLVLHLREMRHYPLVVLLVACSLSTYVRFQLLRRGGFRVYCVLLATLLVILFQVFTLPYAALTLALGLHQLGGFLRERDFGRPGLERLARGVLPLALSALALAPVLWFFETFQVAGELARSVPPRRVPFGPPEHLGLLLRYLTTQELLLPAALAKLAATAAARARRTEARSSGLDARVRASHLLWLFVAVYVTVCSRLPFSYERYVVVLSPVLVLAFVLDTAVALELTRRRPAAARRSRLALGAFAASLLVLAALVPARWPALRGRWHELQVQYRGPVDFMVAALRARYERPEELTIATNYESVTLVYYLGSKVTIGFAGANLAEDMGVQPDVIIRRRWPQGRPALDALARRAPYAPEQLPVRSLRYNNIPQLGRNPFVPEPHHFETALPRREGDELVLLHREPRREGG